MRVIPSIAMLRDAEPAKAITFEVRGMPQTQGSMKAFMPKGARFPIVTHQKGAALMSWRGLLAGEAAKVASREKDFRHSEETIVPWTSPVGIEILFLLQRPKSHYKPNGELRKSAPGRPAGSKHDLDKLVRAVLDALTGIFYRDDGQVCEIRASKRYGAAGARVTLEKLPDDGS